MTVDSKLSAIPLTSIKVMLVKWNKQKPVLSILFKNQNFLSLCTKDLNFPPFLHRGDGSCLELGAQCTYFWKNLEVFKLKLQGFRRKQVKYMHLSINRSNLVRFSNFFFSRKLMKIVIWLNIGCAIAHPAHPLPPPLYGICISILLRVWLSWFWQLLWWIRN